MVAGVWGHIMQVRGIEEYQFADGGHDYVSRWHPRAMGFWKDQWSTLIAAIKIVTEGLYIVWIWMLVDYSIIAFAVHCSPHFTNLNTSMAIH
jgi:hypothetical protein